MAETFGRKEEILAEIEEKLKEEKWTRATIETYSVRNFVELDEIIRTAIDENFKEDLKLLCKEHLKQSQSSIVGLYLVGVISLEESSIDDTHLPQIIKIFVDHNKNKIAEFLAEKILTFRENKFALKTLEEFYEAQGAEEELFNIKKRLVLIDSRDAANANFLGEYYEKEGDKDMAMFYYRLAIERYLKSRSLKMVEELWNRIIAIAPDDYHLVTTIAKKIVEVLGEERTGGMVFDDVVKPIMKDERYEDALKFLKFVVDLRPSDKQIRKAIEDCYRHIYAEHSQLDKYIKKSAIGQTWKSHREAIRNFETHIAFDEGSFVQHKSWGVGKVKEISDDNVIIDFEGKPNHKMTLKIALRALSVLEEDSVAIWKQFKLEELKELVWNEPLTVIESILKSRGGEMLSKEIKAVLIDGVIEEKQWTKFWTQAKRAMEKSNRVVQSLTKHNMVELRDTDMTITEELVSKFKKATNFDNKVSLYIDFVNRGGNVNEEDFSALPSYFLEVAKASSESPERRLLSNVALKYGRYEQYKKTDIDPSVIFAVKNLREMFENLSAEFKQPFLEILEANLKDWDLRFADFILKTSFGKFHNWMLKKLVQYEKYDMVNRIFVTIMNDYQESPILFIWVSRLLLEETLEGLRENVGIRSSELVFRLISLIDILNHEIDQKMNVGTNKKVVSGITDILFKKDAMSEEIDKVDEGVARSLMSLLVMCDTIEDELKDKYVEQIQSRFPHLEVSKKVETVKIRHPFLVTMTSIAKKQEELQHIMDVEIPENSRNIGEAMEKGDLRENAEYKAALEKQDQLKAAAARLESELGQAKMLKKDKVDTTLVDVGTKVKLKNKATGEEESYAILGQWEADPEAGVLSYHSPFGKALLDKRVGDIVSYDFGGENAEFEVLSIELAEFESI